MSFLEVLKIDPKNPVVSITTLNCHTLQVLQVRSWKAKKKNTTESSSSFSTDQDKIFLFWLVKRGFLPGQQQRSRVPPLPGPAEGVPGPAGGPGAAGPCPLSARKRPLQPDHHVWAGVISQHAEEAGAAGRRGLPRRRQLQHSVPQTGVRGRKGLLDEDAHPAALLSDRD